MKNVLLSSVLVLVFGLSAEAHRNQSRERNQQSRIRNGVQSGELTQKEAKKLRKGQRKVDRLQKGAMEDGVLSPEEKARIEKAQDRQSKRIYRQKHDAQRK